MRSMVKSLETPTNGVELADVLKILINEHSEGIATSGCETRSSYAALVEYQDTGDGLGGGMEGTVLVLSHSPKTDSDARIKKLIDEIADIILKDNLASDD